MKKTSAVAERTKAAMAAKRAKGDSLGHIPYGYIRLDGKLLENHQEQTTITCMKVLREEGRTYASIANTLNSQGISPKTPKAKWYASSVFYVLKRAKHHPALWDIEKILQQEGIKRYTKDIRLMSREELLKNFSSSSNIPKAALIIKNIIWQAYSWIKAGKHPLIEGNIRSFWYSHIKPTLARVDLLSGYDHYETMLAMFVELVGKYHLFRYADFGFDDENWENRRIATKMFNVILFAEKAGWFRTLKEFYDQYGMTIVALGGTPSLLSTEYMVKHLSEVTTLDQTFYLISAVDYDVSGWIIANSFAEQLRNQGIEDFQLINIIALNNYMPEEIELFKYPVPNKYKKKVERWLKATGGIGGGQAYGLEADSMPRERFKKLVREELARIRSVKG